MNYYCTHFDHSYLPHGLALINSMQRHCGEFKLYVLALDLECHDVLTERFQDTDSIQLVTSDPTLLAPQCNLAALQNAHTWKEFCWLLEPVLVRWMLSIGIPSVTYIDSDVYFFSSPDEVLRQIPGKANIGLTPHRFPAKYQNRVRTVGRFNFGFGWFRANNRTRELVDIWLQKTLNDCNENTAGDQKHLNDWIDLGEELYEFPAGVNTGPWQLPSILDNPLRVPGGELICYHFHELRRGSGRNPVQICGKSWSLTNYDISPNAMSKVYQPYLQELAKHDIYIRQNCNAENRR